MSLSTNCIVVHYMYVCRKSAFVEHSQPFYNFLLLFISSVLRIYTGFQLTQAQKLELSNNSPCLTTPALTPNNIRIHMNHVPCHNLWWSAFTSIRLAPLFFNYRAPYRDVSQLHVILSITCVHVLCVSKDSVSSTWVKPTRIQACVSYAAHRERCWNVWLVALPN